MKLPAVFLSAMIILVPACSSDDDDDILLSPGSSLTVKLSDAPIEQADHVYVEIAGLEFKALDESNEEGEEEASEGQGGSAWGDYDFDPPLQVDLLDLQGGNSLQLLHDDDVPAGSYKLRLKINQDADLDTYIVLGDGSVHELTVPSGNQTGLKINTALVVPVFGEADYTVDFDVRRSVVARGNGSNRNFSYALKPVLRLVDNTNAGSISGTFDDTSLFSTDCSDDDPLTHNVVYIFEGAGVTPDDYGSAGSQAVTTATVNFDEQSGEYHYTAAFLPVGQYTVSLTCNADLEDVEADDELLFKATETRAAG